MATARIQDSLAYHVYRVARLLRRHFLTEAKEAGFDLTQEQWFVLNKLARMDGRSQVELSEDIFADRPNMTRILATMERRGLVRRVVDEEDQRKIRVHLTPKGRKLERGFSEWALAERARLFAGIAPQDLETAQRVLGQLEDNLQRP